MTGPDSTADAGTGRIVDGTGDASAFVAQVADLLRDAVGFQPFPGTLNLDGVGPLDGLETVHHPLPGDDHCDGLDVSPCRVGGVRAAVIRPLVPNYPDEKTELVAPVRLRSVLQVETGDALAVSPPSACEPVPPMNGAESDRFGGVVFDLDGTLVDLDVDWPTVHERLESLLGSHLDGPITDYSRSEVYELAASKGCYGDLDELVGTAEIDGAASARERDALSLLPDLDCPVGVCTANASAAARRALERFDVLGHVDSIVGRDTVPEDKPHPRTLTRVLDELGVEAGNALYVGDEPTDEELAVSVGTSYGHVEQLSV